MSDTSNPAPTPATFDPAAHLGLDADAFYDLSAGEQRAVHMESLRRNVEKIGDGALPLGPFSRTALMDGVEAAILGEVSELLATHPHEFMAAFRDLCVALAPLDPERNPMPDRLRIGHVRRLWRLIEELTEPASDGK